MRREMRMSADAGLQDNTSRGGRDETYLRLMYRPSNPAIQVLPLSLEVSNS